MTEEYFKSCVKLQHFPKDDLKKQAILAQIMHEFKKQGKESYSEQEVNSIIIEHYEDFALIRRELVNFGYLSRDSLKGEYKILKIKLDDEELDRIGQRQKKMEKDEVY